MSEDESLLRVILAQPADQFARLVYADWLDDHADPRAEYLRLGARVAELPFGRADRPALRQRMLDMQAVLPSWWLAIVGFRATEADDGFHGNTTPASRREDAALILGRPVKYTNSDGYEMSIEAASVSGLTGVVAYLESRSKWNDRHHDIRYYLRLHAPAGGSAVCEPYTYNPYFGCRVGFMEWYGDAVVMIYDEKHDTYACRFGFDGPPVSREVEHNWILDGRELGFRRYAETEVRRISVPDLSELSSLSEAEARERELLPAAW